MVLNLKNEIFGLEKREKIYKEIGEHNKSNWNKNQLENVSREHELARGFEHECMRHKYIHIMYVMYIVNIKCKSDSVYAFMGVINSFVYSDARVLRHDLEN